MIRPLVLTFAATGTETARRVAYAIGGIVEAGSAPVIRRAFEAGTPIIGVCAAGILIRILATLLDDKFEEPPVLAVSQDGMSVVPLLGGHHGANRLAREIAKSLGGSAALTTASDARFTRGLDDPPSGYRLADPASAKPAMAAILAGAGIRLVGDAPWLVEAGYPMSADGAVSITVTERTDAASLVYHPQTLVAGVGCARLTPADQIIAHIEQTFAQAGLSPGSLAALASIDLKADEPGLRAAAAHFGVPLRLFTPDELALETVPNPSAVVAAETGTPSVAEASALKAGPLLVEKRKAPRVTCAIGRSPQPIDPVTLGRAPGMVHIVGIGPGDAASRTTAVVAALDAATDWVGYGLYLDLVADLRLGQVEHRFPLGEEEVRVRHALELAATGRTVALISSGDAQIYAMAALAFELLDATAERALSPGARRVGVETHPGISALQAASAAAGALIGHDFCTISLSDLLTPRADIVRRLSAAASGDFVTALYNPRSGRRTDLLDEALQIFLAARPPQTPVIVARDLGRPAQSVEVVPLAEFDPTTVDMLTIVLIGSSHSRAFQRGDGKTVAFTPRGYAAKARVPA